MPKLIRGDQLNGDQRRQVLAAYVHRWTHENARQTYRGLCPACEQAFRGGALYTCGEALRDGPVTYTSEQWHAYHKPLQTDEQFLAEHAFKFTNDGVRLTGRYAEPSFLAG